MVGWLKCPLALFCSVWMSFMQVEHHLLWDEWTTHWRALWCYFPTRQWSSLSGCSRWCSETNSSVFEGITGISSSVWGETFSLCVSHSLHQRTELLELFYSNSSLDKKTHVIVPIVQVHKFHPDMHLIVTLSCYHVTDKLVDDSSNTFSLMRFLFEHSLWGQQEVRLHYRGDLRTFWWKYCSTTKCSARSAM